MHTRRPHRWDLHDYRRSGLYFVTVCTANRRLVLGDVIRGSVDVTELGRLVEAEWNRTVTTRAEVIADASVVMPNHVHLLFGIVDVTASPGPTSVASFDAATTSRGPTDTGETDTNRSDGWDRREFGQPAARSVSTIVGGFKAAVTREARRLELWDDGPLWQTRFHDRVVRSDREADHIRRYIAGNPARWATDRFNPDTPPP